MPAILWPDGRITRADGWHALLRTVQAMSWNRHMDEMKLRTVLARRARVWSGEHIDPYGPPRHLFEELERTGMLRILSMRAVPELRLVLDADEPDVLQ